MKNVDEMTQSVLARAEKERIVRKKRNRMILSAVVCACCLTAAILIGIQRHARDPLTPILEAVTAPTAKQPSDTETNPLPQGNYTVTLLSMTKDGSYVQLLENVATPLYAQFRIRDVRGLTEEERDEAQKEEEELAEATLVQLPGEASLQQTRSKEAIITLAYAGKITVHIEDNTQVENISVTSAAMAKLDRYTWSGKDDSKLYSVTWFPSDEMRKMIEQDPTQKPSCFRDTITFTVTYKDGTVKTAQVAISFDDEGNAYIAQGQGATQDENTWVDL